MSTPLTSTTGMLLLSTTKLPLIQTPGPIPVPPVWTVQPSFGQSTYNLGDAITINSGIATGTITVSYFKLDGVDKSGELIGLTWSGTSTDDETPGTVTCKLVATNTDGSTLSTEITAELEDITSGEGTAISFGALTLATAGGVPRPTGATSITGAGGTHLVMSGTSVVAGTGGGVSSGSVTFNNGVVWTVTALANTYSVSTVGEMVAVNTLGATTLSGKTMRLRPGVYDVVGTNWLSVKSFTSNFTIASHDTDAFPGIGSQSHDRVKIITYRDQIPNEYGGMGRLIFDGVCIEGRFDRSAPINGRQFLFEGNGGTITDVIWQNCWLKGDDDVLGGGNTFDGVIGRSGSFVGSIGIAFRSCRVSNIYRCMQINRHGRKEVTNCQLDHYGLDAAISGWSGPLVFTDNFIYGPSGDRAFVDWTRQTGGQLYAGKGSVDASIPGLSDGTEAVAFFRADSGTAGVREVVWSFQALNGTAYAQMEKTAANKFRFWAKDSGGTTRVDLTSALTLRSQYVYNILVSVDNNGGTNEILVWESIQKQGVAPNMNVVSQAGTGHTLHWNAGGMSICAENTGTTGVNNFRGSAGRWLFHPGISIDVNNAEHRGVYFDETIGNGPVVEDHVTFGQPLIDLKPSLAEWRSSADGGPAVPNDGSASISCKLRGDRKSVEAGHVDAIQGITNQNEAGGVDAGPINVERVVMFSSEMDGSIGASGGQGFFFEDITKHHCHIDVVIRNCMIINAGPHGATVYNPDNAKYLHNTVVSPPALSPEFGQLMRLRFFYHNQPTDDGLSGSAPGRANGCMRSNLAHELNLDSTMTANLVSCDTHPIFVDNTELPHMGSDSQLGTYFKGMNGDGSGFSWASLTSLDAIKTMFATHQNLNPVGVVKRGWDAYWNEPSPWEGTCGSGTTIASISGPGESAFVTPSSVSVGGIAVHTNGFLECRLFESNGTAVSDWTTKALHLSSGQKFKVRRTSGTGTTIVYFGNRTANWQVT